MRSRQLLLALLFAGLTFVGMYAAYYLIGAQPAQQPAGAMVLAATVDVSPGVVVEDPNAMFAPTPWPANSVPPQAISNAEDLRGKVLARGIYKGSPVTSKDISQSATLFDPTEADKQLKDKNLRAVTIRVNLESSLHGFVQPGSRIDLLCTLRDLTNSQREYTVTFLQNVLVLAVNTIRGQQTETGVINNPTTVTLAVTPQDAQRVTRVKDRGSISISLRKPGDDNAVALDPLPNTIEALLGEDDASGSGGSGTGKSEPLKEVWVATENVTGGRFVTNPQEYFVLERIPAKLADDAFTADNPPKGFLHHFVAKAQPVTKAHFQPPGKPGAGVPRPVASADFEMTIRQGLDPEQSYQFRNNRLVQGGGGLEARETLIAPPALTPDVPPGPGIPGTEPPLPGTPGTEPPLTPGTEPPLTPGSEPPAGGDS